MSEFQVLSSEEVDAILKASQEGDELTKVLSKSENAKGTSAIQNTQALSNLTELIREEFEKILGSFLRKKAQVKIKTSEFTNLASFLKDHTEKNVFSAFHIMPNDHFGMFVLDYTFLHQTINLLFGGRLITDEAIFENVGNVGIIITEKLSQLCLSGFTHACKEYGEISCEPTKTTPMASMISHFELEDQLYFLDFILIIEEFEMTLKLLLPTEFLHEFIPVKTTADVKHREKDFWRSAIKSQVVDSFVNVTVNLPDITMKVQDFMSLKDGDLIPIGDPTLVYVCLNSIKLFRAMAGQSNSKRVAKILNQI